MKDIKLIEAIVVAYYRENKDDIKIESLKELLIDSLNIEIDSVILENNTINVYYDPEKIRKKLTFQFHNDKIKTILKRK